MWRDLIESGHWSGEIWNRRKDGRIFPEMLTITAVRDALGNTQQYVALFSGHLIDKATRAGTATRGPLRSAVPVCPIGYTSAIACTHAMAQTERRGGILAVVCLDLDNFKGINDRHGHTVGDELLTTVAHRMKSTMQHDDLLPGSAVTKFIAVLRDFDNPDQCLPVVKNWLPRSCLPACSYR